MTNKDIREAYNSVVPTDAQKEKMLDAILSQVPRETSVRKDVVVMKKYSRKPALVAALIALMFLLVGCAAVVMLGLKDLKIGESTAYAEPGETGATWDVISLQGYAGSPGYQAAMEWQKFMEEYDPDGQVSTAAQFHHYEAPENYETFNCRTQEMRDKLDEICAKYNLKLPGKGWQIMNIPDIFEATGIPNVQVEGTGADIHMDYGYCYADGSFHIFGGAHFPGQQVGDFLYIDCNRKGTFGISTDSVTNIDDFDQWMYTTKDGTEILLGVTGVEVVMIADRPEYFTTVRLYGEGCSMVLDAAEKRKMAEEMADCFNFSISPQNADSAMLDQSEEDWNNMQAEMEANLDQDFRKSSYGKIEKYSFPMDGSYALSDLDGDGYEELILALMDGNVETIVTYDGEQTSLILEVRRLRTIYIPDNVKWWLAEGNILVNQVTCGSCQRYAYYHLENGEYKLFDVVEYHDETKSWSRSQDGDEICELELSEAEAKEITGSYTPMNLNFKPVSEFPRD